MTDDTADVIKGRFDLADIKAIAYLAQAVVETCNATRVDAVSKYCRSVAAICYHAFIIAAYAADI